jgi:hypothetical protein
MIALTIIKKEKQGRDRDGTKAEFFLAMPEGC